MTARKSQSLSDMVDKNKNYTEDETSVVTPQDTLPAEEQGGNDEVEQGENVDQQDTNVINKTPADLAAESPAQTQERYGINDEIPDDVHNNPNIQVSRDNRIPQIASGTHLHPDIARDTYNDSLSIPAGSAAVTTTRTEFSYAQEANHDDKGLKHIPVDDEDENI